MARSALRPRSAGARGRQFDGEARASARRALDAERAAGIRDPLLDAEQANPLGRASPGVSARSNPAPSSSTVSTTLAGRRCR